MGARTRVKWKQKEQGHERVQRAPKIQGRPVVISAPARVGFAGRANRRSPRRKGVTLFLKRAALASCSSFGLYARPCTRQRRRRQNNARVAVQRVLICTGRCSLYVHPKLMRLCLRVLMV